MRERPSVPSQEQPADHEAEKNRETVRQARERLYEAQETLMKLNTPHSKDIQAAIGGVAALLDEELSSLYAEADRLESPNAAVERGRAKLDTALSAYGYEVTERHKKAPSKVSVNKPPSKYR